jgi:pimeloyl-ACP methyl ester carboxylesterase
VVEEQVDAGLGDQGRQALDQLVRLEEDRARTVVPGASHLEEDLPAGGQLERLLRDRGTQDVSGQMLAFSRIAVPALVFSGDRDGCISSEVYSGIEGAFTSPVRFEIVRGAGHFLPLEAMDRVADLAIPFARS